jgi:hypothetical protein
MCDFGGLILVGENLLESAVPECIHHGWGMLQEIMLDDKTRRKLSVHVMATPKAAASAGPEQSPPGAADAEGGRAAADCAGEAADGDVRVSAESGAAGTAGEESARTVSSGKAEVQVITDVWAFKRAQELYPSPR